MLKLVSRCSVALMLMLACCSSPPSTNEPDDKAPAGQPTPTPTPPPSTTSPPTETPAGPRTTDLFVKTFGDPKGQPVIYLHGGPGANGAMFEESLATRLAEKGMFAVSYDQRGSGRSPKEKDAAKDFTFAKFVQDLDDVIQSRALKAPILIGHSWGGTLAVKYMTAHPGIAKATVLVGNPVDFPGSLFNIHERCEDYYRHKPFSGGELAVLAGVHARMFPKGRTAPFVFAIDDLGFTMKSAMDCNLYFPSITDAFGAGTKWAKALTTSPNRDLLTEVAQTAFPAFHKNEHLAELDLSEDFKKVGANLFAIYGDHDGLFDTKQLDQIRAIVTPPHFTLLKGASHFAFIDDEDEFISAFQKHMQSM